MLRKIAVALMHLSMLALVCAVGAYWAIRIMTPTPASVPPPPPAALLREADPLLAARMFGLVQAAPLAAQALNVQALGAFAAGRDSAAVLAVDGKPARVYLLNQEVFDGARLVEVRKDAVTIEQGGARREITLPPLQAAVLGDAPPAPGYTREGNTLTAPSVATQPAPPQPRPLPQRPSAVPQAAPPPPLQPPPGGAQATQAEATPEGDDEGGSRRPSRSRALAQ